MRHLVLLFFSIIPIYSASRLLLPDAYGLVRRTVGRNQLAAEEDAIELAEISEAAETGALALGEVAVALSPAAPVLLICAGVLALGGLLGYELEQALGHAKSKSNTNEDKLPKCRINIQTKIFGGYELWPLVLDPWSLTFKEVYGNGDIDLEPGEMLRVSCPGANNIVTALGTSDANVECHAGAIFKYAERHFSFYELGCRVMPASTEQYRGNDGIRNGWKNYYIGFRLNSGGFVPTIELWYDNLILKYTHHRIGREVGIDQTKPPQVLGDQAFRQGINPVGGQRGLYDGNHVFTKMTHLLGSSSADAWFGTSASSLDKGHLAAKGDFAYASQQAATFYYFNANPQFHGFNSINWLKLEKSIRMLAALAGKIDIYSGVKDVLNLHDGSKRVDVYLDDRNELPIPQYFWKVVRTELGNKKYAFVGFNNPIKPEFFHSEWYYENNFCYDKCWHAEFWWLQDELNDKSQETQNTGARDPMKGLILCCMYNDEFKQKSGISVPLI